MKVIFHFKRDNSIPHFYQFPCPQLGRSDVMVVPELSAMDSHFLSFLRRFE